MSKYAVDALRSHPIAGARVHMRKIIDLADVFVLDRSMCDAALQMARQPARKQIELIDTIEPAFRCMWFELCCDHWSNEKAAGHLAAYQERTAVFIAQSSEDGFGPHWGWTIGMLNCARKSEYWTFSYWEAGRLGQDTGPRLAKATSTSVIGAWPEEYPERHPLVSDPLKPELVDRFRYEFVPSSRANYERGRIDGEAAFAASHPEYQAILDKKDKVAKDLVEIERRLAQVFPWPLIAIAAASMLTMRGARLTTARAAGGRAIVGGKTVKASEIREVRVVWPRKVTERVDSGGAPVTGTEAMREALRAARAKARRHDVMGHWCERIATGDPQHAHDWHDAPGSTTRRQECDCGRVRWWKNNFERGDASLGRVERVRVLVGETHREFP